jgi:hypothetical protein
LSFQPKEFFKTVAGRAMCEMRRKLFVWFARTRFGGWLGSIGSKLDYEHRKPIMIEIFGEDYDKF